MRNLKRLIAKTRPDSVAEAVVDLHAFAVDALEGDRQVLVELRAVVCDADADAIEGSIGVPFGLSAVFNISGGTAPTSTILPTRADWNSASEDHDSTAVGMLDAKQVCTRLSQRCQGVSSVVEDLRGERLVDCEFCGTRHRLVLPHENNRSPVGPVTAIEQAISIASVEARWIAQSSHEPVKGKGWLLFYPIFAGTTADHDRRQSPRCWSLFKRPAAASGSQ
jgi:hypothetical protein